MPALRIQSRRGVYLISTLMLLMFMVMLSGALMVSFQQGLASSGNFQNRQLALQAALAGLQYVQARMETNVQNFGPSFIPAPNPCSISTQDGSFQVIERKVNGGTHVFGLLSNNHVAGPGEGRIFLGFRAVFNASHTACSVTSQDWSFVNANQWDWGQLPAVPYLSTNNLARATGLVSYSYASSGVPLNNVPGGMADVLVEGMALQPGGGILSRRTAQSVFTVGQLGTVAAGASAARDFNLEVLGKGGIVTVTEAASLNTTWSSCAGISAYQGNINYRGPDAASSSTSPPAYSSTLKASVSSARKFDYSWDKGSASYSPSTPGQTFLQAQEVQPPAIDQGQLPAQARPVAVEAGTWAVWNGKMYHYPTDYDRTVPLAQQQWAQADPESPPTYKGQAPDSTWTNPSNGITFDSTTNTLTVKEDLLVQPSQGASGFAFVVAPEDLTDTTGKKVAKIAKPAKDSVDSSAIGSAQVVFDASSGTTPQFRSPGNITVMGNVLGQGSMVSTGTETAESGNITVIGKSSLDPRSDSGVALYAARDLDILQLSHAQKPHAVPDVADALTVDGIVQGSGTEAAATPVVEVSAMQKAIYQTVGQAMIAECGANGVIGPILPDVNGGTKISPFGNPPDYGAIGVDLNERVSSVSWNGQVYSNVQVSEMLRIITGRAWTSEELGRLIAAPNASTAATVNGEPVPSILSYGAYTIGSDGRASITKTDMAQFAYQGDPPPPVVTASPTPSTKPKHAALNQSFSGLVYAGRNVTMSNRLGNVTIVGAMAAYGGDPSRGTMGTDGGNINLSGSGVNIVYDPSILGPFAGFFGGQVKLRRTCIATF